MMADDKKNEEAQVEETAATEAPAEGVAPAGGETPYSASVRTDSTRIEGRPRDTVTCRECRGTRRAGSRSP